MKKKIIRHDKPCKDHEGRQFPNIKSMCEHWHIHPATFMRRRKVYKMSLRKALTTPVKPNGGQQCRDHEGTLFRSKTLMCQHWNIERKTYDYRISHGWSQEKALTTSTSNQIPKQ